MWDAGECNLFSTCLTPAVLAMPERCPLTSSVEPHTIVCIVVQGSAQCLSPVPPASLLTSSVFLISCLLPSALSLLHFHLPPPFPLSPLLPLYCRWLPPGADRRRVQQPLCHCQEAGLGALLHSVAGMGYEVRVCIHQQMRSLVWSGVVQLIPVTQ